jgi:hypothetical protein
VKAVENITDHQEKEEHNWNSSSYWTRNEFV